MAENQRLKFPKEEERESEEETVEEKPLFKLQNSLFSNRSTVEAVCREQSSQLKTLVSVQSLENDSVSDSLSVFIDSSETNFPVGLSSEEFDVKPRINSPSTLLGSSEFKEQFGTGHQEVLACVRPQAQVQMRLQAGYSHSLLELYPVSLKQSISSAINPCPLRQRPPTLPQDNNFCTAEIDQRNSDQKMKAAHIIVKAPSADGYNWRKYGQKLVKSNNSSRSYYRCTHINCHAKKKVERCDHSGRVIEIIYKGRHNHDPPRKIRRTKARRCLSSVGDISSSGPGGGSASIDRPVRELNVSDPATSTKKPRHATPEQKLHSSGCALNAFVKAEEHCDELGAEQRMKGRSVAYAESLFKTVKEPKVVVQAPGDVGISGDGYRWRKYGQKMVKGNPNPRSYYKCTSAGCPVRKHVERATEDTATIMITYEGHHDHDMPVPKKRHGPPSAARLIAAADAMNNAQLKKSESLTNPKNLTQLSMNVEGGLASEKASELGGEKALESARTLLSIGIELRPY